MSLAKRLLMAGLSASGSYWIETFGDSSLDTGVAIRIGASGDLYVAGRAGTAGPLGVARLSPTGALSFRVASNNTQDQKAGGLALDASDNVYLVGGDATVGTADRIVAVKLDAAGLAVWRSNLDTAGQNDYATCADADGSGNLFFAGRTEGAALCAVKLSNLGAVGWQKKLGPPTSGTADGMGCALSGAVLYVAGQYVPSDGIARFLTVKYNASTGALVDQRQVSGVSGNYRARAVAVDASGNVYVAGDGDGAALVVKYNSAMAFQWARAMADTASAQWNGVAVDAAGDIFLCGQCNNGATTRVLIAKYSAAGALQFQRTITHAANTLAANSIAVDASALYIAGDSSANSGDAMVIRFPKTGAGVLGTFGGYTVAASALTTSTPAVTDAASTLTEAAATMTSSTPAAGRQAATATTAKTVIG